MNPLDEWTTTVTRALGLDPADLDREMILDLARDVAHAVTRPAAPLTAFLVGLAAGRAGGGPEQIRATVEKAAALANGYTADGS